MTIPKWSLVIGAVLTLVVCLVRPVPSQPVRARLLRGAEITREAGRIVINVGLNFPTRYLRHFPRRTGETLQIYLQPVAISRADAGFIHARESAQLRTRDHEPLRSVTYEGDVLGGPLLTFLFDRAVEFDVRQGEDFRSFIVSIADEAPAAAGPASEGEGARVARSRP